MKKTTKLMILVSAIGILAVGCNRSPEKFAEKITTKVADELKLDDAQKLKLDKIKTTMLTEHKERAANRGHHREALKKMALADRLDKSEVKTLLDKKKGKIEAKFEKYFPLIEDFHASLNPDQKQKLVELAEKMYEKRRKHWH